MIKLCLSQSTAHGVANIANEPHVTGKYLWLVLTVVVTAVFIFHTSLLHSQYREEQISSTSFSEAEPFIQPDIVFCPQRMFARDFIRHPPQQEFEFMSNVSRDIQDVDKRFRSFRNKLTALIWDSINLHRLSKAFFHRRDELFFKIICETRSIDPSLLTLEMSPDYLTCYRLNYTVCPLISPLSSLTVMLYTHNHGLDINDTRRDLTFGNNSLETITFGPRNNAGEVGDGVHVYFVQPGELIHKSSRRVSASPNTHADVSITSTRYTRVPTSRFSCQKEEKMEEVYNLLEEDFRSNPLKFTEASSCLATSIQMRLYNELQCTSKLFPIPLSIPPNFTFCATRINDRSTLVFFLSIIRHGRTSNTRSNIRCLKMTPCSSVKHSTIVSYEMWPQNFRRFLKKELFRKLRFDKYSRQSFPGLLELQEDYLRTPPISLDEWKQNFIKVTISPDEHNSTLVEESYSYSFKNFFCDMGGILGFYLGASVLTLCELFRLPLYAVRPRDVRKENEIESNSLREDHV